MLALPGSAYLYQGEELGLEQVDVPPELRQDPGYLHGGRASRDGCRVPIPWSGDAPPFGFGPGSGQPWLPQPAEWEALTVERQQRDPDSTLAFYREVLRLRREHVTGLDADVDFVRTAPGTLAFRRGEALLCMVNCGSRPAKIPPEAGEPVVASGPLGTAADGSRRLPPDTAAWFTAG
jgi:alpha-glucosidase